MNQILNYLNESPTVFFIINKKDDEWKLDYVTDNVEKVYGKTSDDFIQGRCNHEDFIHKDDFKRVREESSSIKNIKNNEFTYQPYRIIKDSESIWINHTTKIIRDENGKIESFYGYITDITKQKEIYNKFTQTTSILDTSFDNSFNFILLLDSRGKLLKANETALDIAGIAEEHVLGRYYWELPWWKHYDVKEIVELREDVLFVKKGACTKSNRYYYNTNGRKIEIDCCLTPVFDEKQNVTFILCEAHDITQSQNNQKKLNQYMEIVNENVFISISDLKGNIVQISDAYCKLTGYTRDELIGKKHSIFKHPDNDNEIFKDLWKTITKGRLWKGEHKNVKKDGSIYWVENSITPTFNEDRNITGYTSIYNDITDKKEISELLITDYLTKVYNRRHFNDVFSLELKRARRNKKNLVLMILDIDYFKQFNDNYGHDEGDKALVKVASTIKETLNRASDFFFRIGGEEFAIITSEIDIEGVNILASKIHKSIENRNIVHDKSLASDRLTLSIGIKILEPESKIRKDKIFKLADNALYEAKNNGRNQTVIS